MPTACFAELYFSPVVGLSLMVDLNLAYLLKGERANTSTTQLAFVLFWLVGFFGGFFVFFPHHSKCLSGPVFHLQGCFFSLLFIADLKNIFHTRWVFFLTADFFLFFLWDNKFFQDLA